MQGPHETRVTIMLKSGVLDRKAARSTTRWKAWASAACATSAWQVDRTRPRGRRHARCRRGHVPAAARQHGDRELSDRGGGGERDVKAAVIVFPGSNCDRDLAVALLR
jgi:hypothetical protein